MSLSTSQIDALIDAARRTARTEILPYFRALDDSEVEIKTHAQDLVTKADRASERALTAAAREIFPDAMVLGEEAVSEGVINVDALRDAPLSVIIDPIDGTWNYANGLGMFGVILAVVANGETVFGLLYDPLGDDWVAAEAGSGAWFRKADGAARHLSVGAAVPVEEMTGYWPPTLFDRT
ncbi:MAG: inositol monophosphatase family protein, partial [Pseudomonadota bacterium]|nr:inositol monophosphatase family protein [Pseudomonadota bacterium]